jgi:hypothetical protein
MATDLEQDGDGDGAAVELDGVLVAVEPDIEVVKLRLHVQLDVVYGVLGGRPVKVYEGQHIVATLKVGEFT